MSGISDDIRAEVQSKIWRICVIGNSYTGAIKRAYELGPTDVSGYALEFFANPGADFTQLGLDGRRIVNAPFSGGGSAEVDDYDAFVVYGDLPTPTDIMNFMSDISADRYSRQVRAATLQDWLSQSHVYRICEQLSATQLRPLFLLSRNYSVDEHRGDQEALGRSEILLSQAIKPVSYIPFPAVLFGDDGRPSPDFYSGSLNVAGVEPDRAAQPTHHLNHLNQLGGELVLAAIMEKLRVILPPPFTTVAEKPRATLPHRLRRWMSGS